MSTERPGAERRRQACTVSAYWGECACPRMISFCLSFWGAIVEDRNTKTPRRAEPGRSRSTSNGVEEARKANEPPQGQPYDERSKFAMKMRSALEMVGPIEMVQTVCGVLRSKNQADKNGQFLPLSKIDLNQAAGDHPKVQKAMKKR